MKSSLLYLNLIWTKFRQPMWIRNYEPLDRVEKMTVLRWLYRYEIIKQIYVFVKQHSPHSKLLKINSFFTNAMINRETIVFEVYGQSNRMTLEPDSRTII